MPKPLTAESIPCESVDDIMLVPAQVCLGYEGELQRWHMEDSASNDVFVPTSGAGGTGLIRDKTDPKARSRLILSVPTTWNFRLRPSSFA